MTGVGRVLRRERPETKIIVCEPANAALLGSGAPQPRGALNAPAASNPAFQPHPIQGWTPDFIPFVLQEAVDQKLYDQVVPIPGPVGMEWSRKLARILGCKRLIQMPLTQFLTFLRKFPNILNS